MKNRSTPKPDNGSTVADEQKASHVEQQAVKETNGPKGPEPTRYGDWERKGRCVDF